MKGREEGRQGGGGEEQVHGVRKCGVKMVKSGYEVVEAESGKVAC